MNDDLLRRAADRIDSYSAPIKTEAWDYDKFEDDTPWVVHLDIDWDDDDVPTIATTGLECTDRDRAGWIALLGPHIAGHLAAWLRSQADETAMIDEMNAAASERAKRTGGDGHTFVIQPDRTAHATYLARAILGEET